MSLPEPDDKLDALARAALPPGATPAPSHSDDPDYASEHDEAGEYEAGEEDAAIFNTEIDDESGLEIAQAPVKMSAANQTTAASRTQTRKLDKHRELKALAAPILLTVGLLLLIPAFWSVLVLIGAPVPMAGRADAPGMAKVMLLSWPLALTLLIPAVLMFIQLSAKRHRK